MSLEKDVQELVRAGEALSDIDDIPPLCLSHRENQIEFSQNYVATGLPPNLYLLLKRHLTFTEVIEVASDLTQDRRDFLQECFAKESWSAVHFFTALSEKIPLINDRIDQYRTFGKNEKSLFGLANATKNDDPIAYVDALPHDVVVKLDEGPVHPTVKILETVRADLAGSYLFAWNTLHGEMDVLMGTDETKTLEAIKGIKDKEELSKLMKDKPSETGYELRCFGTLNDPNYNLLKSELLPDAKSFLGPNKKCEPWLKKFVDVYAGFEKEKRMEIMEDLSALNPHLNFSDLPMMHESSAKHLKHNATMFRDMYNLYKKEGLPITMAIAIGQSTYATNAYCQVPPIHRPMWIELLKSVANSCAFVKMPTCDVPTVMQAYETTSDNTPNRTKFVNGLDAVLKTGTARKWAEAITKLHLKDTVGGDGYRRMNDSEVIAA
jgi:hypothetical protein